MNINQHVVVPQKQGETGRTVLFVSELPENITEEDLSNFFSEYKDSIFMTQINNKFGNSRGLDSFHPRVLNATVIFKDHKKADDARRNLNMRKLRGKTIRIMWHERDNNIRYNTQGNLFIKNIPLDVKARQFYEKFLQFGDIISAKLIEDEEGNHNGYGYVSYYENESADNAIKTLNDKEVWPGSVLEVARFQKKNERFSNNKLSMNKNLYVKNIPDNFVEADLKSLFAKHGNITWTKILVDTNQRKSAIVSLDSEEDAHKAKEALNNHTIGEFTLYVDSLQKKSDRQRILSSKINENNSILNSQFKNCNLHIKNLPDKCTETQLHDEFSKYGEIKSLKIPKYILVSKIGTNLKEETVSRGFGYVCFFNQDSAKKAKEEMNGKLLSVFSEAKRPLLIDFFQPKIERKNILLKYQQQFNPNARQQMPLMNPMSAFTNQFNMNMPFNAANPIIPPHKQPKNASIYQPNMSFEKVRGMAKPIPTHQPQFTPVKKDDDPDLAYYNSIEEESAKKEYLGEFIFKKISNHPLNHSKGFTIDIIGKITGMILGIDDLSEILDICRNHENLTSRIVEALSLLNIKL